MSFTQISTIVQISDNDDYDPNFGQLPTPAFALTNAFTRRDELIVSGTTSASGTLFGLAAATTRVLVHNKDTTNSATVFVDGSPDVAIFTLAPGETTQWKVPSGGDPTKYGAFAVASTAALLVMAWGA